MIRIAVFFVLISLVLRDLNKLKEFSKVQYKDLIINHKQVLIQYVFVVVMYLLLGSAFKLSLSYLILLVFSALFVILFILKQMRIFDESYEVVMQLILVMTHLSHQFKSHQKIEHALASVFEISSDATIQKLELVQSSIQTLSYQDAFLNLHHHYLLQTLVTTMAHAQEQGDDHILHALDLIEQDIDDLNNHVFLYIQKMISLRNRILLLSVFGLVISLVSQNMLNMVVDLTGMILYQDIVFIFLLLMMVLLGYSFRIMTLPLLMKEELLN